MKSDEEVIRQEQLAQMSSWLSNEDKMMIPDGQLYIDLNLEKTKPGEMLPQQSVPKAEIGKAEALKSDKLKSQKSQMQQQQIHKMSSNQPQGHVTHKDKDETDDGFGSSSTSFESHGDDGPAGTTKVPPCAHYGRYYCSYKEDYPIKVVTEVTKYYKWPLEKLFRDLRHQVMPSLANDLHGGLVCDSITRIVRPGWSKNTNGRWLVVINTEYYQQYITEVICRHGTGSYCNFIPPCYQASCRQRYNTQKLLVIDPWNPYKGPFLSEFLFPSCCICFVPSDNTYSASNTVKDKYAGTVSERGSSSAPGMTITSAPTI